MDGPSKAWSYRIGISSVLAFAVFPKCSRAVVKWPCVADFQRADVSIRRPTRNLGESMFPERAKGVFPKKNCQEERPVRKS